MKEEYLRIGLPNDKAIYGCLRSDNHKKLIIHAHGMTHSMHHMLEVMAADYFPQNGYDHFALGFYARMPDARPLNQSTISTHVKDLQAVIDHFKGEYDALYLSAHSLSGLVTLILNPTEFNAISLWDPAFDVTNFWKTSDYLDHMPERGEYQVNYGNVFVVNEAFVDEIAKYPDETCRALAGQMKTPVQMIIPDISIFLGSPHTSPEAYADAFAGPFELERQTGANHTFSNMGDQQTLFNATLNWFDQF